MTDKHGYGCIINGKDYYWDGKEWTRELHLIFGWDSKTPKTPPNASSAVHLVTENLPPRPKGWSNKRNLYNTNLNLKADLQEKIKTIQSKIDGIPSYIKKLKKNKLKLEEELKSLDGFEDSDFICMRCTNAPGWFYCDGSICDAHNHDWLCKKCYEENKCYECT